MLIDHIIYADPDLDTAVAHIEKRFGVRAGGGGKHMGQGTHNKLLALGPRTYLEIIAADREQPEPSHPRPYGVDGVTRAGLVGWALGFEHSDSASLTPILTALGADVEVKRATKAALVAQINSPNGSKELR